MLGLRGTRIKFKVSSLSKWEDGVIIKEVGETHKGVTTE